MFSKRQLLPYQPKIHLPVPFPRESRSPKGQRSYFYKKERKENVNEHSQRDNHYPNNPRFTYRFHFQENLKVQEIRSYKKERKENINERSQRDNHHPTNSRFTYWSFSRGSKSPSKRAVPTKKKKKINVCYILS